MAKQNNTKVVTGLVRLSYANVWEPKSINAGGNKEKNIANAQRYCRFAVDSGCLPLAPHLYFPQFMDDSDGHDHNTAMFMNMILMTKCAEVWVFGNNITKGMAAEIRRANETQKPVRYFSNKCKEVH